MAGKPPLDDLADVRARLAVQCVDSARRLADLAIAYRTNPKLLEQVLQLLEVLAHLLEEAALRQEAIRQLRDLVTSLQADARRRRA